MAISRTSRSSRRGTVAAFTAVGSTVLIGFVALSVDVGMLYNVRAEMQRAADAGALAGAWTLVNENRLKSPPDMAAVFSAARSKASQVANLNDIYRANPIVDLNGANAITGDVVIGRLNNPNNLSEPVTIPADPMTANTLLVRVHRDDVRNGPIELWFARIFGINSTNMVASAAATLQDGVTGYKVTEKTGNANVLPFALHIDFWNKLLTQEVTTGDKYRYDHPTKLVSSGQDGVFELNLYPGSGGSQLPPGNFGTVDIGSPDNSTSDITRQILTGLNANDLAYFGGELKLGSTGTLPMQGETGMSLGFKDDLAAIIGQPRAIPLFDHVQSPGNNAVFRIVGFAGIRIMKVDLASQVPDQKKALIVQPAMVVDDAAITGGTTAGSYVYLPVRLTR